MPNRQKVSVIPLGTEVLKASDLCSLEAAHNLRVITFGFFRSLKGIDVAYHAVRSMADIDYVGICVSGFPHGFVIWEADCGVPRR
jgi:hypothetical protein